MSCHTWIYTKIDHYNTTLDELLKKYCIKITYEDGKDISGYYDLKWQFEAKWRTETQFISHKDDPDWTKIIVTDIDKVPDEIKSMFRINSGVTVIPNASWSIQFDQLGIYKESDSHDIFRISNYPSFRLHSYEEAKQFINSKYVVEKFPEDWDNSEDHFDENGNWYELYRLDQSKSEVLSILKKFYAEHPDTLITFG